MTDRDYMMLVKNYGLSEDEARAASKEVGMRLLREALVNPDPNGRRCREQLWIDAGLPAKH